MKKKTTTISLFTIPRKPWVILGLSGLKKLLTMFSLMTTLATTCYAQGISAGTGIVAQQGTVVRLSGNLTVHQDCRFDGLISLTGHVEDHFGLELSAGDILFNGDGAAQVISGESLSIFNNMEIAGHANVQVSPSKKLTVSGHLLNHNESGGLVLQASDQGITASLLHHDDNVAARVEKYFAGPSSYHQLSSPVQGQNFEPEFYSYGDYVFTWFEPFQTYITYENTSNYPTFADANEGVLEFLPARGYFVYYSFGGGTTNPKVFSGLLHQGSIGFMLNCMAHPQDSQQGLNFMGNPYPSAIDWNAEEGWSGKEHLHGDDDKNSKVIWIWNDAIQNYGAVLPRAHTVNHNDRTGVIPAMQGFWVRAADGADGEVLAMDDRVRLHAPDRVAQPESTEGLQVLRVSLSSDDTDWADEVVIEFGHDGKPAGAAKMFSPNPDAPQLFAVHHENEYSILLLNETDAGRGITLEAQMPLPGGHTISIAGSDVLLRQLVVEDKHTGSHYRFGDTSQLRLDMPEGHSAKRFVLHFDHFE